MEGRKWGNSRFTHYVILLIAFWLPSIASADRGDDLLPLVQSETLKAHIIALQENVQAPQRIAYRTRSAYRRDASDNAAQYIASQFRRSPRLKVEFEAFSGMKNVVAKLPPRPGSTSNRIFILCAHYDTQADGERGWNPLTSEAPGADDNGTGVAAMLEIAHLLSQYDYDHELRFIAFDGKEIGLMGSRYHVKKASQVRPRKRDSKQPADSRNGAGENIVAVFNLDMIGFNWKTDLVEVLTDDASVWGSEALRIANSWYDVGLTVRRSRDGSIDNGDHQPFWEEDYRAVTLTESTTPWQDSRGYEANPFYGTSRDTIDKINLRLVRKVTQLALVALDSLASRSFQTTTQGPRVTIDPLPVAHQNPVQITGHFESAFPIEIVVDPGNVPAQVERFNRTYSATVALKTGANRIRASIVNPLGAGSVEQIVQFEPDFEWTSVLVFPNPSRSPDVLTVFRAEGNLPMEEMNVFIYAADGSLVRRIQGVADSADPHIWRVWWNQQTAFGLAAATGIYVCRLEAHVNGKSYSHMEKLAIIR